MVLKQPYKGETLTADLWVTTAFRPGEDLFPAATAPDHWAGDVTAFELPENSATESRRSRPCYFS